MLSLKGGHWLCPVFPPPLLLHVAIFVSLVQGSLLMNIFLVRCTNVHFLVQCCVQMYLFLVQCSVQMCIFLVQCIVYTIQLYILFTSASALSAQRRLLLLFSTLAPLKYFRLRFYIFSFCFWTNLIFKHNANAQYSLPLHQLLAIQILLNTIENYEYKSLFLYRDVCGWEMFNIKYIFVCEQVEDYTIEGTFCHLFIEPQKTY